MTDGPTGEPGNQEPPAKQPVWARLIAPLRSEDAAFGAVLRVAAAALLVIAVVVLVRLVT